MEKIGILGGTFDPIHLGHLIPAEYACNFLGLSRVILIPAAAPVHRPGHRPVAGEHRFRMCQLAAASIPGFSCSDIELRRTDASYTIITLRALRAAVGISAELVLLVGEDNLPTLHTWRDIGEILELATVAILPRPSAAAYDLTDLRSALGDAVVDGILARRVPAPLVPISSTQIRARLRLGQVITGLVPTSVADYIAANRLYGPETET
jgi:nicotinate-nucleotide adenylyltransferase